MAIAKLGYTGDMLEIEPYLVQPLMLAVHEPDDREIYQYFNRLGLLA